MAVGCSKSHWQFLLVCATRLHMEAQGSPWLSSPQRNWPHVCLKGQRFQNCATWGCQAPLVQLYFWMACLEILEPGCDFSFAQGLGKRHWPQQWYCTLALCRCRSGLWSNWLGIRSEGRVLSSRKECFLARRLGAHGQSPVQEKLRVGGQRATF